ncbi:hypothetical protein BU17DRAFT_58358 [Hysterangium stoloniferum]|nr:hypothetical protein BU17DRAFT_58358 [Hysterangium stoloniferum]
MSWIRCRSTRLAINLSTISPRTHVHVARVRGFADNQGSLPPVKPDPTPEYTSGRYIQDRFGGSAVSAFKNLGKIFAWVGYGTIVVGLVTITAYEGAHLWIENKMSIQPDGDAERWGWEPEAWSGGKFGGTSSALGLYGRHAARAAWFTLHYNSSLGGISSISPVHSGSHSGSLSVVDSDLHNARLYLESAIGCMKNQDGTLRLDKVVYDLLERHAAVLERIGTRAALVKARDDYILLFEGCSEAEVSQAKFAVKLGNICNRLGDGASALAWWLQGINLTRDDKNIDKPTTTDARTPPNSPTAQRTLVTALLALSAYYTREMRLQEAQEIEERAISLINAMIPPTSASASQTAAQTLHYTYLTQRKSVFTLHHAEVTHAIRSHSVLKKHPPIKDTLTELSTAASISEQVARALTEQPAFDSGILPGLSPDPVIGLVNPLASKVVIASSVAVSPSLRPVAQSLLRDARLTAAEAWDLSGVLYSEIGDGKAMQCFERALVCAGEPAVAGNDQEGMSTKAWEALWGRYVKAKEKWAKTKDDQVKKNETMPI